MASFLQQEDGFYLLQEDGSKILLDQPPVRLNASANIAAGAATATTAQLTAPAGKTSGADFQAGAISDDTNPLPSIDLAADKYTEVEFSLHIADDTVIDDGYEFRLTDNGTPLDTYTITPVFWVGSAASPQTVVATAPVATFSAPTPVTVIGPVISQATAAVLTFSATTPAQIKVTTVATAPTLTFGTGQSAVLPGAVTIPATAPVATFGTGTAAVQAGPVTSVATAVPLTFTVGSAAVLSPITLAATAALATFTAPTPGVSQATVSQATAAVLTFVPATTATIAGPVTLTATAAVLTFSGPSVTSIPGVVVAAASSAVLTLTAPQTTILSPVTVAASSAVLTFGVTTAAVQAGPVTSIATPAVLTFTVTTASASGGQIAAATAPVLTFTVTSAARTVGPTTIPATAAVLTMTTTTAAVVAGPKVTIATAAIATFVPGTATDLSVFKAIATAPTLTFQSGGVTTVIPGATIIGATAVSARFMVVSPAVIGGEAVLPSPLPEVGIVGGRKRRGIRAGLRGEIFPLQELEAVFVWSCTFTVPYVQYGPVSAEWIVRLQADVEIAGSATQTTGVELSIETAIDVARVDAPRADPVTLTAAVEFDLGLSATVDAARWGIREAAQERQDLLELAIHRPDLRDVIRAVLLELDDEWFSDVLRR